MTIAPLNSRTVLKIMKYYIYIHCIKRYKDKVLLKKELSEKQIPTWGKANVFKQI